MRFAMKNISLTTSSYCFTTGWARFAGAGYFDVAEHKDERHEWT